MTDEYISRCGWWSVDTKPFSTVCGTDTEYKKGKCVSTLDITMDNIDPASVCGTDTEYRNGKCVSTLDITMDNIDPASVCGTDTEYRNGKCVSTLDITMDNIDPASVCGMGTEYRNGKCENTADISFTNANVKLLPGETIESRNSSITCSANIRGNFEDSAAGVLMRKPQLRFLPLDKQAHLYNCFYHASKGKKEGLLNDSKGKADPNAILNDLYDALDGTNNRFFQDIYGHNGVFTYCLRGHG